MLQLSGGVALIVWFTTNGMWVKNNTIIYVARTSNNRVIMACELYCCLLPQCEALRICRSGFPIVTIITTLQQLTQQIDTAGRCCCWIAGRETKHGIKFIISWRFVELKWREFNQRWNSSFGPVLPPVWRGSVLSDISFPPPCSMKKSIQYFKQHYSLNFAHDIVLNNL